MKEKIMLAAGLLAAIGMASATLVIPPDQPICNLYGIIQVMGTIAAVIVMAYSGFILASSHEMEARNSSKMLIAGAIIGLIIIWLAPLIIKSLVGATNVCGW